VPAQDAQADFRDLIRPAATGKIKSKIKNVTVMKPEILYIGSFPDATAKLLHETFKVHHFRNLPIPADAFTADQAKMIRGIATEANRGATREMLERFCNVEVISVFGVGTDAVDVKAARERNIPVTNTPDVIAAEVADLAVGMMLASARQIIQGDQYVRDGSWAAKGPISLGRSVGRKTCGVIGLGGIGRAIADRAAAFRMRVIYQGPRKKPDAPYDYIADPVEIARQSDYLMVSCKGGEETRHLVSQAVIEALGPNGTLINVARGTVVDEPAMIAALKSGKLGFAALDVFENEPNVSKDLLALPNVLVQPHHGSATIETRTEMGQLMFDNIAAHFAGKPLLTPV
jgi:lactate dehydrogenase-like 2-hydroxyacid dehydrogenase